MEGRKISNVWFEIENFQQSSPSRIRDVLCVFFFHHRTEHKTVRESARATVKKVEKMWSTIKVPLVQEIRSIERIEHFFENCINVILYITIPKWFFRSKIFWKRVNYTCFVNGAKRSKFRHGINTKIRLKHDF